MIRAMGEHLHSKSRALGARNPLYAWAATDTGRVRKHNEDSVLIDSNLCLYMVADGMGGHAAGEIASRLAVQTVRQALDLQADVLLELTRDMERTTSRRDVLRLLESSVQQACAAIYKEGRTNERRRGMGTTLDVLLIAGNRGFIAHVGDSRVYLLRQESIHQLTEDHSLVNEMIKRGRISENDVALRNYKNAVTRAVGVYESVNVDLFDLDVLPDDRFLLCSDGLHEYLDEAMMQHVVKTSTASEIPERMIEIANQRGGGDNISVVFVHVPEASRGTRTDTHEVQLKMHTLQKVSLFRSLSYRELVRVLNITQSMEFAAGETVVSEGDAADSLYIVVDGSVSLHKDKHHIGTLDTGQHFGEMALIDRAPRNATVISEESSRLLMIRRDDFMALLNTRHEIATKLLWSFVVVLTKSLRTTSSQLQQARDHLASVTGHDEFTGQTEVDKS